MKKGICKQMNKLNKIVLLIAVLLVFFFLLGGTKIFQPLPEVKKEYDYLSLISEVISLVKMEYVEEIQPGEKFPGAFSGMLNSLDKFSAYLDASQSNIYRLYRQGKVYNCGIYGAKGSNYFYITDIVPGSPAQVRGLKPGDAIKAINGKNIFGQSFWDMYLSLLTDKPGVIEIVLLRNGNGSTTPGKLKLETVPAGTGMTFKKTVQNIHLLQLPRIDAKNVTHLEQQLENEALNNKPLKLIIDLRQYSGGDLDAFIRLTRLLLDTSIPLTLKTKHSEKKLLLGSTGALNYRAVVIINTSTRMYGELLAILLKEYSKKNVTLMGAKTKGFISKLKQFPLDDGSSVLLTEGLFLLDGKDLANQGVTPDIKIKRKHFAKIIALAADILKKAHD
jgi:carboxyl-terminal processing protease